MAASSINHVLDRRAFAKGAVLAGGALVLGALGGCGTDSEPPAASAPAPSPSSVQLQEPAASEDASGDAGQTASDAATASPVAVVYFSVPLTDADSYDAESGASVVQSGDDLLGNVQYAARWVASLSGGELIRIVPDEAYPTDDAIFDLALEQQNNNDRPAITLVDDATGNTVADLSAYDTVLVGYPIWWYELPMPMDTFFENYDLAGKVVAPFVVHGGSGFSGTVEDIEAMQPDATVEQGLSINRRNVAADAESDVTDWLSGLGLLR